MNKELKVQNTQQIDFFQNRNVRLWDPTWWDLLTSSTGR